jgi:hypothetical protein
VNADKEMTMEKDTTIAAVIMRTERDDTGIDYSVHVQTREPVYENGDNERGVWQARVDFGASDAYVAGGPAFVAAARTQQRIADEVWYAYHDKPWTIAVSKHWESASIWG